MVKELFICDTANTINITLDESISYDTQGDIVPMVFSAVLDAQGNNVGGQPLWLVVQNDGVHGDINYQLGDFDVDPAQPYPNDQQYTIVVGTALGNYHIVLNPACPVQLDNSCCGVELAWINREGGISNAYFIDKKTISTDFGEGDTYKVAGNVKRFTLKNPSARKRIVSTGKVDKEEGKLIESLATAIQAWERVPSSVPGQYIDLPILVNNSNLAFQDPGQRLYEWLLTYEYAQELTTQNG